MSHGGALWSTVAHCGQLWPTVVSCGWLWLWPLECRHLLLAEADPGPRQSPRGRKSAHKLCSTSG